jgi:hypothetical protein
VGDSKVLTKCIINRMGQDDKYTCATPPNNAKINKEAANIIWPTI